jgi:4'-phosphopantetheinyl transferase
LLAPHSIIWQSVQDWPSLPADECHLWQCNLHDFPAQPDLLNVAEQQRWRSITQPQTAQRFCATRTILRQLLGHYLSCDPEHVRIQLGTQGKPELAATPQPLFFNLSHTADIAVLAFYVAAPIGIDVEQPRPVSAIRRIAERVFDSNERHYLQAAGDDPDIFLRLWVRHEARQKCLGLGLLQAAPATPPLDFFAGTWGNRVQLSLAWVAQPITPKLHFFSHQTP